MSREDDDDDDELISQTIARYPCMPSLVALQQIRNRLHLAYVGKKLMKWTAMATGRELRKLAVEITSTCDTLCEDVQNAFILLARARFYCPIMDQMVLENIPEEAPLKVQVTAKSVTGVKILLMKIMDNNEDPYPLLCLSRGGQAVMEAKNTWRELLKRMILMVEYRNSFMEVDLAHKSATKRKNTLTKVVIPRSKATIHYILQQMEEQSRENFYRMKMVLNVKRKKMNLKKPPDVRAKSEEETKKCYLCGDFIGDRTLKLLSDAKVDDAKLQELKLHLNEIVDITKQIEEKSITSSLHEFIKTAASLKDRLDIAVKGKEVENIPTDETVELLCNSCREHKYFAKKTVDGLISSVIDNVIAQHKDVIDVEHVLSKDTVKSVKTLELCKEHAHTDLELGFFEVEIEEITKIIRVRNEDGTMTEQKQLIRKRQERKLLQEQASTSNDKEEDKNSNNELSKDKGHERKRTQEPFVNPEQHLLPIKMRSELNNDSKTIGLVSVKDSKRRNIWRAYSDAGPSSEQMGDPVIISSLSDDSFLTGFSNITEFLNSDEGKGKVITKKDLLQSSTEIEEMLKLHELHNNNVLLSPNNISFERNNSLTRSEKDLLDTFIECKFNVKLKSENDVRLPKDKNNLLNSVSLNINRNNSNDNSSDDFNIYLDRE